MENTDQDKNWEAFVHLFSARHEGNGILSAEFDSFRFLRQPDREFPVLSGIIVHILVLSGQMEIRISDKVYCCSPGRYNAAAVKPTNELQDLRISGDFKGYVLGLNRSCLLASPAFRPRVPVEYLFSLRFLQTFTLSMPEAQYMFVLGQKIERNFSRKIFVSEDLIHISVLEFHLEMLALTIDQIMQETSKTAKSSKYQLCIKFSDMVFLHCREQHEVAFYAERLCITPQYLTRIFRDVAGMGAKEAIDKAVVSEASTLLHSDMPLQQITDELHFTDQSAFGKFFKKHTGMTPARFRRENHG